MKRQSARLHNLQDVVRARVIGSLLERTASVFLIGLDDFLF
jgi:hypothetical protein